MSSLVLIKPDAFERGLQHDIMLRLHTITTVYRTRLIPAITQDKMDQHYAEHIGKPFYPSLCKAMVGGQALAVHLYGDCQRIRTECLSIRGHYKPADYVGPKNIIHSSDSEEAAEREIEVWFGFWNQVVEAVLPVSRVFDFPVENLDSY